MFTTPANNNMAVLVRGAGGHLRHVSDIGDHKMVSPTIPSSCHDGHGLCTGIQLTGSVARRRGRQQATRTTQRVDGLAAGSWLQTMLSVELFMMLKVEGWILFE